MKRCILCGKEVEALKQPLTEEHIIPYALGNDVLKGSFLCKYCNSNLGDKVDAPFVNSFEMELIRKQYGIQCRGATPNPFKEGQDENGLPIRVDNDMMPHIVPTVKKKGEKINIRASTREEAKSIIRKKLERKNYPQEKIEEALAKVDTIESKKYNPTLSYPIEINIGKKFIAILKIAYEYAYYKLGDLYFDDTRAIEIRKTLQSVIEETWEESKFNALSVVNFAPDKFEQMVGEIKQTSGLCHMLLLQETSENCLLVFMSLFCKPSESYLVLISDNAKQYNANYDIDLIPVKTKTS